MEATKELAIIDYNYLLKEFEHCQKYKLVIPHPHIKTLQGLMDSTPKNVSLSRVQQLLDYLEENAIILSLHNLPNISVTQKGIKPKTVRFVRYVVAARAKYPDIKVISNSRETKYLLKQLNIPTFKN